MGKTTTVSDSISVVLLVSDENCKVAASVEGSREQGIVSGERVTAGLNPLLNLNFLSKQADLKPGQKVYTSGVGGVFPSGLLVGVVKSFRVRELDGQGAARAGGRSLASRGCVRGNWPKMIFFFLLLVLVLIAQIAEFFIPALPWLYNAHIYIVPVIVFMGQWRCRFRSCSRSPCTLASCSMRSRCT